MAGLPNLALECADIVIFPRDLCILFPGGTEICAQSTEPFPQPADLVRQLFAQLNAALAPLAPFFNLLDVVITVVIIIKAIPEGPSELPPFKTLMSKIPGLVPKVAKILGIIPPLSVPFMILGFIDAVLVLLEGFVLNLQQQINQATRIVDAETRAAQLGSAQLVLTVDCARHHLDAEFQSFNEGLSPLNMIFGLINLFMDLIGLEPIPSLASSGADASQALQPIRDFIDTLKQIRATIPV